MDSLPNEILSPIIVLLKQLGPHYVNLNHLSQTCKRMHSLVTPLLYSHLKASQLQHPALLSTVTFTPALASLVKSATLLIPADLSVPRPDNSNGNQVDGDDSKLNPLSALRQALCVLDRLMSMTRFSFIVECETSGGYDVRCIKPAIVVSLIEHATFIPLPFLSNLLKYPESRLEYTQFIHALLRQCSPDCKRLRINYPIVPASPGGVLASITSLTTLVIDKNAQSWLNDQLMHHLLSNYPNVKQIYFPADADFFYRHTLPGAPWPTMPSVTCCTLLAEPNKWTAEKDTFNSPFYLFLLRSFPACEKLYLCLDLSFKSRAGSLSDDLPHLLNTIQVFLGRVGSILKSLKAVEFTLKVKQSQKKKSTTDWNGEIESILHNLVTEVLQPIATFALPYHLCLRLSEPYSSIYTSTELESATVLDTIGHWVAEAKGRLTFRREDDRNRRYVDFNYQNGLLLREHGSILSKERSVDTLLVRVLEDGI